VVCEGEYLNMTPWDNNGILAFMTHKETEQLQALVYGIYLEIGTFQGHSLISVLPHVQLAYSIDWRHFPTLDKIKEDFKEKVIFIQNKSQLVHHLFADNSLDCLFIDGNHHGIYPRQDFELYNPKVKIGGLIIFHDNAEKYPVVKGLINELKQTNDIKEMGTLAWFIKETI